MKCIYLIACAVIMMTTMPAFSQTSNILTEKEKKDGWKLLFDGKSLTGWRKYNGTTPGPSWKVSNGELYLDTLKNNSGGDIITEKEYQDFELILDWKISRCGNSGVIFNVVESKAQENTWYTGPEIQMLDNACHPDGKIPKHRAGNLYDLIASTTESVLPAGEWNHFKIVSNKAVLEIWLNGVLQVKTTMFTPEWEALIKNSKFKDRPDFGRSHKGHLALQDHGNMVVFKNIKIKEL